MIALTFDDGLPCHYKAVIPELNRRGMKATFFVPIIPQDGENDEIIFDVRFRDEEWINALNCGHEIGGHSVRHRKVYRTPTGEIPLCQKLLKEVLGVEPRSYAWPYCETNQFHMQVASRYFDQVRGGCCIANRFNYPSHVITDGNIEELIAAPPNGVYTFHGVGEPGSWGNISFDQFRRFLDKCETSVTFAEYMKEIR